MIRLSATWLGLLLIFTVKVSLSKGSDVDSDEAVFSCSGKVIGGYYADVVAKCQTFHVCTIGEKGEIRDIVFRCINGTVFHQETRVCEREEEVDCSKTVSFYYLNNELYGPGIIPIAPIDSMEGQAPTREQQVLDPSDVLMPIPSSRKASHSRDPTHESKLNPFTFQSSTSAHDKTVNKGSTAFKSSAESSKDIFRTFRNQPPFTITRTASSTSVSASSRVHIETPLSRFSLSQGDLSHLELPAPHLRPSLLKLAAQSRAFDPPHRLRRSSSCSPTSSEVIQQKLGHASQKSFTPNSSYQHKTINKIRSLFIEPLYRGAEQKPTKTHTDSQTAEKAVNNLGPCQKHEVASLLSSSLNNCKTYQICLPGMFKQIPERTYVCADKGYAFNVQEGRCSKTAACSLPKPQFLLNERTSFFATIDPLRLCSFMSEKNSFVLDILSDCEQFLECSNANNEPIPVRRCPAGYRFSQKQGKCIQAHQVHCKTQIHNLILQLGHLEYVIRTLSEDHRGIHKAPHNKYKRIKRTVPFDTRNSHREASNGALNNGGGIVVDHSVIDPQSSGNVLEGGKHTFPERSDKDDQKGSVPSLEPPTSMAFNLTNFNGTIIEVSEIASPDQSGKVTITSVVPKVSQNGNGGSLPPMPLSKDKKGSSLQQTQVNLVGSDLFSDGELHTSPAKEGGNITNEQEPETEEPSKQIETTLASPEDSKPIRTTEKPQTTTSTSTTTPPPTTTPTTTPEVDITSEEDEKAPEEEIGTTNFTCKNKELEQFYPDIENKCKLFHYCSPGFTEDEVLDLTFLCSGDTRFDLKTKKCQDMNTVLCGETETSTTSTTTTSTTTTMSSTTTTMTTESEIITTASTSTQPSTNLPTDSIMPTMPSSDTDLKETTSLADEIEDVTAEGELINTTPKEDSDTEALSTHANDNLQTELQDYSDDLDKLLDITNSTSAVSENLTEITNPTIEILTFNENKTLHEQESNLTMGTSGTNQTTDEEAEMMNGTVLIDNNDIVFETTEWVDNNTMISTEESSSVKKEDVTSETISIHTSSDIVLINPSEEEANNPLSINHGDVLP